MLPPPPFPSIASNPKINGEFLPAGAHVTIEAPPTATIIPISVPSLCMDGFLDGFQREESSVTGQNVIRLPFCHSTVAVLTEPSLVVKIHNAPSTENPNIHVNDFTRELFGFEVTQGGSRSGVGFTYSPWKSMMEGKEGYENIMRKFNNLPPTSPTTQTSQDKTTTFTTPHMVMSGWELLMVRVIGYVANGAMERNVAEDAGGFDFSLSNVKNTLSQQKLLSGDEEIFSIIVKYYLQGLEPQRGEFVGRLLAEVIFNQYCLRPSGDYEWSHFRSLHNRHEGPPVPPPPITRGDQGYVIKSRWCRHLWNTPLSDLFQQGFYSTCIYVMGCKSLTTKSLGFNTRAVRVCKVNEWVEWGETWLEFYNLTIRNKGLQALLDHYHTVIDVLLTVLARAPTLDPNCEPGLTVVEKMLRVAVEVKQGHLMEAERIVDEHFGERQANASVNDGYAKHCRFLNGYRPYFHHKLGGIDVVENISELSWQVGRFSSWRGRADALLRRGWGEGLRSKKEGGMVKRIVERTKEGLLSVRGREAVLSGSVKCDPAEVPFVGDFLDKPVGDWEIRFLVDTMVKLTRLLNESLGLTEPPLPPPANGGEWERKLKVTQTQGLQVNLRPLADMRNLFWGMALGYLALAIKNLF
ncbi:hypothetical protein TrRE_jg5340 [Triparma retinervis]|uniref:Uncharacterized protein n=1 Tax=Triparma retinervis TaxID=2557542 RepID=A0A9W7ACR6_9STRA|nr:hypothetical protein TrRE_jg5340 [Triparma retinervis]